MPGDETDVKYVLRADDSRLKADLARAENTVRQSAERTEEAIDGIGDTAESAMGRTAEATESAGESTGKLGAKFKSALGTIGKSAAAASAAVGAAAVAVGTAAVKSADSLDKAVNHVVAATGASGDAVKRYEDVIKGVYSDNFGESFEDIADSISKITQNLGEMDKVTLQNITERAYALQDVFDMGVDESSRAAKAMRDNFGISAAEAYDYIAKGAQDGLDYSGELLDSINEYSVQFAKLGFSADDMFNIFAQGAENGAWNLDKIGDAVKEFSIRAIDGSDTTRAGFEAIGYDADDMMKKFAAGGDVARDAFQTVVSALAEMEDPIARDAAGVNLFGTMWEDLGVEAVAALGNISDSAYDCKGAMDGIMEVNYGSLSDALGGLQRQIETLIQPLGEMLIEPVSDVIEALSGMADEVIPKLAEALKPVLDNLTPLIEPIMELVSSLLPQLVELVAPLIEMIAGLIQTILPPLEETLTALIEPLSDLIADILPIAAELIEKIVPVIARIIKELLPPLIRIIDNLLPSIDAILGLLDPILQLVSNLISPVAEVLKVIEPLAAMLSDLINLILKPIMDLLKPLCDLLNDTLGGALKFVADIISKTLMPAFDGLIKFLSGDFMGGIESWGKGFTDTVSGCFDVIDGIFGTHLSEWYSEFNEFWGHVGDKLYEMTHQDEIKMNELGRKYSSLHSDMNAAVSAAVREGLSAEEALERAKAEVLDNTEKLYYFNHAYNGENGNIKYDVDYVKEITSGIVPGSPAPEEDSSVYTGGSWTPAQIGGGDWRNSEYAAKAGYDTNGKELAAEQKKTETAANPTEYSYTPYIPKVSAESSGTTGNSGKSSGSSGRSGGQFVSITSYVPTMWDNDQTAALKSLVGNDVLGNTVSAHQINELTGAISDTVQSSGATGTDSGETSLADVVNAITKLQKRVDKLGQDVGDMTIELTARDLTIGKAAVRDINNMAKQSGKSPFKF